MSMFPETPWDKVRKLANQDRLISARNNPLLEDLPKESPYTEINMRTLYRDRDAREFPCHGRVYAGIMDNMRYGGSE